MRSQHDHKSATDIGFPFSLQDLSGNDFCECAAHQRTSLAWANQLFTRYRRAERDEVAVEKGIAPFERRGSGRKNAGDLASQTFEGRGIRLQTRQRAEHAEASLRNGQMFAVA